MIDSIRNENFVDSRIKKFQTLICDQRIRKVVKFVEYTFKCIRHTISIFSLDRPSVNHFREAVNKNQNESVSSVSIRKRRLRVFDQITLKYLKRVTSDNTSSRKLMFNDSSMNAMDRILLQEFCYFSRETRRAFNILINFLKSCLNIIPFPKTR